MRFNQIDYADKQDLCSNIIQKKIYGLNGDWEPLRRFRGDCKYSTYLYRIVMNETISFLKSKGMKYKPKPDSIDQVHNLFNEPLDINDKLSLEQCLLELKDRERKIINLAGQGYKQREIADMLDEKSNTIAAIISRANRKLKKCFQYISEHYDINNQI